MWIASEKSIREEKDWVLRTYHKLKAIKSTFHESISRLNQLFSETDFHLSRFLCKWKNNFWSRYSWKPDLDICLISNSLVRCLFF